MGNYIGRIFRVGTVFGSGQEEDGFQMHDVETGEIIEVRVTNPEDTPRQPVRADHPYTDPGDGRTECLTCGKWVFPAIHSCKRVPVTEAALKRRQNNPATCVDCPVDGWGCCGKWNDGIDRRAIVADKAHSCCGFNVADSIHINGARMSSNYKVICMSHDPALVVDLDFYDADEVIQRVQYLREHCPGSATFLSSEIRLSGIGEHKHCKLMVGRYSYPLVELACLDGVEHGHSNPKWIDTTVLRLLAHIEWTADTNKLTRPFAKCFGPEVLNKLRYELEC